ncbi:MAG: DUF4293 domain-containing protein [Saprospiraceae bacterium]|jgi:hypothetical protein|nr:DUF4293 domain-containing protein [Lewinellaceae bacterium]
MIQRIQSIFLLLAAGALGGQFALPYLQTPADDPARSLTALADGVLNPLDNPGLLGLTGLGALISLAAIFLFKNRSLQMRLALVAAGIGIMLLVLLGITVKNTLDQAPGNGTVNFAFGLGLPVLALLFNWLAARAIRKDEALVRSMDRLR